MTAFRTGTPEFLDHMYRHPVGVTESDIIYHVLHALWYQGRRAVTRPIHPDEAPQCVYRAPDGARCAAGWCLTDNLYKQTLEGKTVVSLVSCSSISSELPNWFHEHINTLENLQRLHDEKRIWASQESVRGAFLGFLVSKGLAAPVFPDDKFGIYKPTT